MARFSINQPLKGIEIYFEDRPSADVLSELKANRWRWLYSKKCWYNTNTQVNLEYAQRICSPKVNLPVVSNVHTIDYDITSSQGNSEESKAQKMGILWNVSIAIILYLYTHNRVRTAAVLFHIRWNSIRVLRRSVRQFKNTPRKK